MALSREDQDEIKRHMGVLQESFIKEVKTIGEGINGLENKLGSLDRKIDNGLSEMRQEVKLGFSHVNQRLDKVEFRLDKVESELTAVKHAVIDLKDDVKKHDQKLAKL